MAIGLSTRLDAGPLAHEIGFCSRQVDPLAVRVEPIAGDDLPQQLANALHGAWATFASRGVTGWPRYDLDRRATMRFDTISEVVDAPRSWERAMWGGIR